MAECKKCGCPFYTKRTYSTADMPTAWKDTDGKWYRGPAQQDITFICDGCGETYQEFYRNGKKIEPSNPKE